MDFFGGITTLFSSVVVPMQPNAGSCLKRLKCNTIKVLCVPDCNQFSANIVEGRFLCDDTSWYKVQNDLFISANQAMTSLFSEDSLIPEFMSITTLTSLSITHMQASIGFESDQVFTFIPLSIFIGQLLLHLFSFDSFDQTHISLLASKYLEVTLASSESPIQQSSFWQRSPKAPKGTVQPPFPTASRLAALGVSLEDFEESLREKCEECYKLMRGYIPVAIFTMDDRLDRLLSDGLPSQLCQHVLTEKILWLLCMHTEDIQKVHFSQLRKKYRYSKLDIVELRAVWYCLPEWPVEDAERCTWRAAMKSTLDEYSYREIAGGLIPLEQIRNHVYHGMDERQPIYSYDDPLTRLPSSLDPSVEVTVDASSNYQVGGDASDEENEGPLHRSSSSRHSTRMTNNSNGSGLQSRTASYSGKTSAKNSPLRFSDRTFSTSSLMRDSGGNDDMRSEVDSSPMPRIRSFRLTKAVITEHATPQITLPIGVTTSTESISPPVIAITAESSCQTETVDHQSNATRRYSLEELGDILRRMSGGHDPESRWLSEEELRLRDLLRDVNSHNTGDHKRNDSAGVTLSSVSRRPETFDLSIASDNIGDNEEDEDEEGNDSTSPFFSLAGVQLASCRHSALNSHVNSRSVSQTNSDVHSPVVSVPTNKFKDSNHHTPSQSDLISDSSSSDDEHIDMYQYSSSADNHAMRTISGSKNNKLNTFFTLSPEHRLAPSVDDLDEMVDFIAVDESGDESSSDNNSDRDSAGVDRVKPPRKTLQRSVEKAIHRSHFDLRQFTDKVSSGSESNAAAHSPFKELMMGFNRSVDSDEERLMNSTRGGNGKAAHNISKNDKHFASPPPVTLRSISNNSNESQSPHCRSPYTQVLFEGDRIDNILRSPYGFANGAVSSSHSGSSHHVTSATRPHALSDVDLLSIEQYERTIEGLSFEDVDSDCDTVGPGSMKHRGSHPRNMTQELNDDLLRFDLDMNSSCAFLLNRRSSTRKVGTDGHLSQHSTSGQNSNVRPGSTLRAFSTDSLDFSFLDTTGPDDHFDSLLCEVIGEQVLLGEVDKARGLVTQNPETVMSRDEASRLLVRFLKTVYEVANPLDALSFIVETLGADVNVLNRKGLNALHVLFDNDTLGDYMLHRGCDLLAKDHKGVTALSYCLSVANPWVLGSIEAYCERHNLTVEQMLNGEEEKIREFEVIIRKHQKKNTRVSRSLKSSHSLRNSVNNSGDTGFCDVHM